MGDLTQYIVWALIGIAVLSAGGFAFNFIGKGKKSKRINTVLNKRRDELGKQQMQSLTKSSGIRQKQNKTAYVEFVTSVVSKLNLQSLVGSQEVRDMLQQAGMRSQNAVMVYTGSRAMFGLIIFAGVLTYVNLLPEFPYPGFVKFLFAGGGGLIGVYLPKILIANNVTKRQQSMQLAFPDALDLMVICVEAGLSIENAFARVTEEIMEASAVLAQELGLTSAELAFLGDRRQAYTNFAKRTGLPAAKGLATCLIQSEQYGTPVGVALKVLSQEKRDERMSAAEKKAASLPAKLTVPMIIFFLPVLFLVVIGPAAIRISNM